MLHHPQIHLYELEGFHGGGDLDYVLPSYEAMYSGRYHKLEHYRDVFNSNNIIVLLLLLLLLSLL